MRGRTYYSKFDNKGTDSLFAGLADVGDIWEEVVVFGLGHGLAELGRVLKHADQDLQAVQVRVLWRDHLKNRLMKCERPKSKRESAGLLQPLVTFAWLSHLTIDWEKYQCCNVFLNTN